jgi:hypothetical protein
MLEEEEGGGGNPFLPFLQKNKENVKVCSRFHSTYIIIKTGLLQWCWCRFIYMGVSLFLEQQSWHNIGFTFFTIVSCPSPIFLFLFQFWANFFFYSVSINTTLYSFYFQCNKLLLFTNVLNVNFVVSSISMTVT